MRREYDFSRSRKNPYAKKLKRQITIRLDAAAVDYFKKMAAELGMPYQNLINLFLLDCAAQKRRPTIQWEPAATGSKARHGQIAAYAAQEAGSGLDLDPHLEVAGVEHPVKTGSTRK